MRPREVPLEPRAAVADLLRGRARVVGSRTAVGRHDLGLEPGLISPYEVRVALGLRYGDPPIEEARYERGRTRFGDAGTVLRWAVARLFASSERSDVLVRPFIVATRVDPVDTLDALERIQDWLRHGKSGVVFFVHPHALNLASSDATLRRDLACADLVLPDGVGLRVAATLLRTPLPANVNGTDLVPELLLELAADHVPIALIGGAPGVTKKAAEAWRRVAPFELLGTWDGFQTPEVYEEVMAEIERRAPCLVLVGFGTPLQERFVMRHLAGRRGVVAMTVGGLFDFASGDKPRAPLAWRELGIEWVWRLVHEPRRLGGRYLIGNPEFVIRALLQRVRGTGDGPRL